MRRGGRGGGEKGPRAALPVYKTRPRKKKKKTDSPLLAEGGCLLPANGAGFDLSSDMFKASHKDLQIRPEPRKDDSQSWFSQVAHPLALLQQESQQETKLQMD